MRTLFQFATRFILIFCLVATAVAQDNRAAIAQRSGVTITASASDGRVRFTCPSSVVQVRLEVYNSAGKKLFDNELRGGNVLDWPLQDGQAEPLADDAYLCVVTVKSLSGRITERIGSVIVKSGTASLRAADVSQMTPQQSEAIGPMEADASLILLKEAEPQTTTVIAHNGEDGQITRGKGALSFRIGDFYSGKDTEQMRLTAEGNLGIGITNPQVRLDVDGVIRASQGIIFPDGTTQYSAASKTLGAKSTTPDQVSDRILGGKHKFQTESVTQNHIVKFTDSGGTLGDSSIIETLSGGVNVDTFGGLPTGSSNNHIVEMIASGTKSPLTLVGGSGEMEFWKDQAGAGGLPTAAIAFGMAQPGVASSNDMVFSAWNGASWAERMRMTNGGNVGIGTTNPLSKMVVHTGGSGGEINFGTPNGESGMAIIGTQARADVRFDGLTLKLLAGTGSTSPCCGMFINTAGNVGIGTPSPVHRLTISGGPTWTSSLWGGALELDNASAIGWHSDFFHVTAGMGVSKGEMYFFTTPSSPGETGGDANTNLFISNIGQVGIGGASPDEQLRVVGNIHISGCLRNDSVTLAGTCSSDLRFKQQVTPFPKLLNKVAQLQPVHFFWRASEFPQKHFGTTQSYGLIAQDVEATLPELVTEDEQGYKQVDYSKLPLLTLQAVKELKAENDALKQQNAALETRLTALEQALQRLLGQQQGH